MEAISKFEREKISNRSKIDQSDMAEPETSFLPPRVSGYRIQEEPFQTYLRGECRSYLCTATTPVGTCSNGDWIVSYRSCGVVCPDQPVCSRLNPSVCPLMGNQPTVSTIWESAPNVECTYQTNSIKNYEDVVRWEDFFGNDETFQRVILPQFCSTETTDGCPLNDRGRPSGSCSVMRSQTEGGRRCREWGLTHPELRNDVEAEYCRNHDTFECRCLNRQGEREYRSFQQAVPDIPASCWYRPCTDPTFNFIPSELQDPICPTDTCLRVNQEWEDRQQRFLTETEATRATICPLTPATMLPEIPSPENGESSGIGWWMWLIIILIVVIAIIAFIVIFGLIQRSNRPTSIPVTQGVPTPTEYPMI